MNDAEVRMVIANHLGVPVELVVDHADFRGLGADSLDLIELTVALEQEFDLRIADDDVEQCMTVADALAVLRRSPSVRSEVRTSVVIEEAPVLRVHAGGRG